MTVVTLVTLTRANEEEEKRRNKPAAQAAGQTLPNAPPPAGKIHQFRKIL